MDIDWTNYIVFWTQEDGAGEGGYAKEMSEEFLNAERALLGKETRTSDVVISTALIPGKPAPLLILEVSLLKIQKQTRLL